MRPVNLIPPEQRRGDQAPARAGAASYVVIAVLFAVLFAVTGYVLVSNDISEKQAELAATETDRVEAEARASALASFADFQLMKDARVGTVASLAESRFDWERVMREFSRVIPSTVWFTNVTGTVTPEVAVPKAAKVELRNSVPGPALTMIGCAASQQDVASLIASMGDIDGVTRVLVERSEKPIGDATSSASDETNASEECRTRNFIAKFALVAAFDDVAASAPGTATVPSATPTAPDASTPEQQAARQNIESGVAEGQDAAGLVGAGKGG